MFRNPKRSSQDTLLPHSGNGRGGGGGLYGTARMTPKASLSKSFIAIIIWALVRVACVWRLLLLSCSSFFWGFA